MEQNLKTFCNSKWEIFVRSIASEGGNIIVLLFLILVLGIFVLLKFDGATEQLYFVLGALVGVLKGRIASNPNQIDIKTEKTISLLEDNSKVE